MHPSLNGNSLSPPNGCFLSTITIFTPTIDIHTKPKHSPGDA